MLIVIEEKTSQCSTQLVLYWNIKLVNRFARLSSPSQYRCSWCFSYLAISHLYSVSVSQCCATGMWNVHVQINESDTQHNDDNSSHKYFKIPEFGLRMNYWQSIKPSIVELTSKHCWQNCSDNEFTPTHLTNFINPFAVPPPTRCCQWVWGKKSKRINFQATFYCLLFQHQLKEEKKAAEKFWQSHDKLISL